MKHNFIPSAIFMGVDPGLSGALAFYDPVKDVFIVEDAPTKTVVRNGKRRRMIDAVTLGAILEDITVGREVRAFVEQVGAMPGQGTVSMFSFGRAAGVIDGELGRMGVDPVYVQPRAWQKAVGLCSGAGKDAARRRAAEVWPEYAAQFAKVKDSGRADASLILLYGLQHAQR